ncbi:MAG: DUF4906 domain-containing protein [Bacteroidales bacterium]|nr:DUF4906 domain-containing protein [Bacteroidales bacterium]
MLALSCTGAGKYATLRFVLGDAAPAVKSENPPEDRYDDINLLVFNSEGEPELARYWSSRENPGDGQMTCSLLSGSPVTVAACVNLGYRLDSSSLEEMGSLRHYLAYPDEYSRGLPMTGLRTLTVPPSGGVVTIPLQRMMARVGVRMDRSHLDGDVKLSVRSVQVGNCPKSALLFGQSRSAGSLDVFGSGFIKAWRDADPMNIEKGGGLSDIVEVYLMENLGEDYVPFIEIKAEYNSSKWHTPPGEYVIYRFYLEGGVERNSRYLYTVRPRGDALPDMEWSVDKSCLEGTG